MRTPFLVGMSLAAATAFGGQLPDPSPSALIGARNLALSPNGDRLAFVYRGDIWVSPSGGGRAIPVTNHIEMESTPVWSRDGKWIAFSSNRTGNWDIFVVPADGGESKRITYFSGSDIPTDWSPDGKEILFFGTRESPRNGVFAVDVVTGKTRRLFQDFMPVQSPRFSIDGKKVIYNRFNFGVLRPRYEGSGAAQVWEFDLATRNRKQVRNNGFQHLWPTFSGPKDSIFTVTVVDKTPSSRKMGEAATKFVDSPQRTPNVYQIVNGNARRITSLVGGAGARFLSAATNNSTFVYESEGEVFRIVDGGKPEKIKIVSTLDDKTTNEERLVLSSGVSTSASSPKGTKIAFEVRGELWMVPITKGKGPNANDATQLTDWTGTDTSPLWLSDDKTIVFLSDRKGAMSLFKLDSETLAVTSLAEFKANVSNLQLGPDQKTLSFVVAGTEGGIYTLDTTSTKPEAKLVLKRSDNFSVGASATYAWSPDMRYLAFVNSQPRSGYYYWNDTNNVFVFDSKTGETQNVTKIGLSHEAPVFSADGKYLFFGRNGLNDGIYGFPLQQEGARADEIELAYEKPTKPVEVQIDFSEAAQRVRRFVSGTGADEILFEREKGDLIYVTGGDIWRANYNGENPRKLTEGGGYSGIRFANDGKQIHSNRNGQVVTFDLSDARFSGTTVAFRADWTRDIRKERVAAYNQFWLAYNGNFYDGNHHGRNWTEIGARYRPFLASVGHRNEMATVLGMMTGELEASHAETSPGPGNPSSQTSGHPGFLFDYDYTGAGIKILEVPANTPGTFTKSKLTAGEIVTKINGKPVKVNEDLFRVSLNEQVGRELNLTVKGLDGKERTIKYRALNGGEFNAIVNRNELESRRKQVEELSKGQLAYVHIAGMGDNNFEELMRQIWERTDGAKGLIIDVRNNGGGNISDRIIDILERKSHSFYAPRDGKVILSPGQSLGIPMVILHHEQSFSNAEMFPYAMKSRGLATLVGMPTPGYVIWTYGLNLIDGTGARMPSAGVFRLDGTTLENMGQQPDIRVDRSPEQFFSGIDPQLSKGVEVLLRKIK